MEMKQPLVGSSGRVISGDGWGSRILRRFARWHYFHVIEQHVPEGSALLEFGSGGGDLWLAAHYHTACLELAFRCARASKCMYSHTINADVCQMPLVSESFDAAASSFVLEHLSSSIVTSALSELHRVLRPRGVLICLCDLDSDHPLLAWLHKKYPDGYRGAFIEELEHLGLRSQREWAKFLRDVGFEIIEWHLLTRFIILDHSPMCNLANGDQFPKSVKALGRLSSRVFQVHIVANLWNLIIIVLDDFFRPILPPSWAYRLLFVARKRTK